MTPGLKALFLSELASAALAASRGELHAAWLALEQAHVISQPYALAHLRVHWHMLRLALVSFDWREALGQVPRLLLAAPGSLSGRAPAGNTGRANVGIFTPMPVPADLRRRMNEAERSQ